MPIWIKWEGYLPHKPVYWQKEETTIQARWSEEITPELLEKAYAYVEQEKKGGYPHKNIRVEVDNPLGG